VITGTCSACAGQAAFAATLVAALVVVVIDGKLNRGEVFATAVFVVYLLGQVVVGVAALRSRSALRTLYALPGRAKARASAWFGRESEAASDSTEAADELYAAVSWLRGDLRVIWPPVFHALIVEVIGVATVWAVLLSLNTGSGLDVALVAYSIGVLFSIVGVLPAGLGFAEASLGAVFVSFGVATATAAAAVIIYRLFEVWVPFFAGMGRSTLKRGSGVTRVGVPGARTRRASAGWWLRSVAKHHLALVRQPLSRSAESTTDTDRSGGRGEIPLLAAAWRC